MAKSDVESFLPRRKGSSEYEKIRKELLDSVQAMSGTTWTDYNLHDPGVTIVEQLAFVLTDINYRSEFTIPDLLADEASQIELERHGIFSAKESLSCRPLTKRDLQLHILRSIPDIIYVEIEEEFVCEESLQSNNKPYPIPGLLSFRIKPKSPLGSELSQFHKAIQQQLLQVYSNVRGLNEDIYSVDFIKEQPCQIVGEIVIDDSQPAMNILSNIYHTAKQSLLGILSGEQSVKAGEHSSHVTPQSYYSYATDSAEAIDTSANVTLLELNSALKNSPGVLHVQSIDVVIDAKKVATLPSVKQKTLRLDIPAQLSEIGIVLRRDGRLITINFEEFASAFRVKESNAALVYEDEDDTLPPSVVKHAKKNLTQYTPVQTHFPSVYGVNEHGVSSSFSKERKAQARQLKGYLRLFDHVMADHLENLEYSKTLFSVNNTDTYSYRSHVLGDRDNLFVETMDDSARGLVRSVGSYVDVDGRELSHSLCPLSSKRLMDIETKRSEIQYALDGIDRDLEIARNKARTRVASAIVRAHNNHIDTVYRAVEHAMNQFLAFTTNLIAEVDREIESNDDDERKVSLFHTMRQDLTTQFERMEQLKVEPFSVPWLTQLRAELAFFEPLTNYMNSQQQHALAELNVQSSRLKQFSESDELDENGDIDEALLLEQTLKRVLLSLVKRKENFVINQLDGLSKALTRLKSLLTAPPFTATDVFDGFIRLADDFIFIWVTSITSFYQKSTLELNRTDTEFDLVKVAKALISDETHLIDNVLNEYRVLRVRLNEGTEFVDKAFDWNTAELSYFSKALLFALKQNEALLDAQKNALENIAVPIEQLLDKWQREQTTIRTHNQDLETLKSDLYQNIHTVEGWMGSEYENYFDRKNRALDFMIAMNGREHVLYATDFNNFYTHDEEVSTSQVASKIAALQNIHNLSSNRGGGVDNLAGDVLYEMPAFIQYVKNLLGLPKRANTLEERFEQRRLTAQDQGLKFAPNPCECREPEDEEGKINQATIGTVKISKQHSERLRPIAFQRLTENEKSEVFEDYEIVSMALAEEQVLSSLFIIGARLDNYKIARIDDHYSVLIHQPSTETTNGQIESRRRASVDHYLRVGDYKTRQEAAIAGNKLCYCIKTISRECEDFIALEHALFRPLLKDGTPSLTLEGEASFYSAQITIVVTGWTARFSDADFRGYIRNLLLSECPAHILLNVLWVAPEDYLEFEHARQDWLELYQEALPFRVDKGDIDLTLDYHEFSDLNAASQRLRDLIENRLSRPDFEVDSDD